ncbi:DUF6660 family protein [Taibaiella soli]|uniref:DUF6660 family protein n=1 Tax=Taibaiella soli TaxID=1649169 RepID=UPI00374229EE
MKFFTLIMSIYLLVLSCIPCNEGQEGNVITEQKISATNQKRHHQTGNEVCTPFCTCSHCPASAFYQPLSHFNVPITVFQSLKYPVYNASFCLEVSLSIWQPPKIV